jgi:hypothetical protein
LRSLEPHPPSSSLAAATFAPRKKQAGVKGVTTGTEGGTRWREGAVTTGAEGAGDCGHRGREKEQGTG